MRRQKRGEKREIARTELGQNKYLSETKRRFMNEKEKKIQIRAPQWWRNEFTE
jgi:hypothetical protein